MTLYIKINYIIEYISLYIISTVKYLNISFNSILVRLNTSIIVKNIIKRNTVLKSYTT